MNDRNRAALTRRETLRLLAAGVAGSALLPHLAHAMPGDLAVPRIDRIGLQLYTVRSALAKDIQGTIAAIAKAGITELEFFNPFGKEVAWWRDLLKQHGLTAPSAHEALPANDEWGPIFDRAHGMGHQLVVVPYAGNEYRGSRANWQKLADRLNVGAQKAKAAGLQFGYHNHDFEFVTVEGTTGYEILTTQTDHDLVKLELDLYWTVKAAQDPLALMKRWPNRIVAVHVKDAGPAPERTMTEVGAGTIDFKTILATGRTQGLQHWFIEHDNPADPIASITTSAAALKKL